MNKSAASEWMALFGKPTRPDFSLNLRLVKKSGQPLLMLPESASSAAAALTLYPAQTTFARTARLALSTALRTSLPLLLAKATVPITLSDPFPRFLIELEPGGSNPFPELAILSGNLHAAGRRFILLLFGKNHQPSVVVKAGLTEPAKQLIRAESAFFQSLPPKVLGLPTFRRAFVSETVEAFALDYIPGHSPAREDRPIIGKLMTAWLDCNRNIRANDVPAWQVMEKEFSNDSTIHRLAAQLGRFNFHPTLFHGDFAPWNIKVSPATGDWTVLDWERGHRIGFPAWDWFHYVVQTAILVQKQNAETVFEQLENLFLEASFQRYAEAAGIVGHEKILAVAYLFHCVNILKPSEGIQVARDLLAILTERFL